MLKQLLVHAISSAAPDAELDALQVVPTTSCRDAFGNDLFLVFSGGSTYPRYVVKMARDAAYNFKIENEYRVLEALGAVGDLAEHLPRALHLGHLRGRAFIIQLGVDGEDLSNVLLKTRQDDEAYDLVRLAARLMSRINRTALSRKLSLPVETNSLALNDDLGLDTVVPSLGKKGRKSLRRSHHDLTGLDRKFFVHGDYWPTNLMLGRGASPDIAGVIDWEFALPDSPVPTDLAWCLYNSAVILSLRRDHEISEYDAFRSVFFGEGPDTDLLREVCREYLAGFKLGPEVFPQILGVALLQLANRELRAYGRHGKMDILCGKMLDHFLENESDLSVN